MKAFEYVIKDEIGIHARPAGMLVNTAKPFASAITLRCGDKSADCKKLMKIMSMGVKCGSTVTVTVEGEDEEAAAKAVEAFLKENL